MSSPKWIAADSRTLPEILPEEETFDMIFSCPPYADLEVYSEDAADISNMEYEQFVEAYRDIIAKACARLRDNRFAVWVVGEVRDKKGHYRNFVGDTIAAFEDAGLRYYNEAVLITSVGSLPLRAGNMFRASRKLGKGHQNVLIFKKGDPTPEPLTGFGEWLGKYFEQNKELLELHEKVLVFVKGDANAAAKEFGPVMTAEPEMHDGE
jgi:DNA modification methylase